MSDPVPVRRFHGMIPPRGQDAARSTLYEGRFGRMFRNLPPFLPTNLDLSRLAETMTTELPERGDGSEDPAGDNPEIPSGFTCLGQFVDHDITFDPTSSLQRQNDPDALHNFRTPRFDLDCVYGSGPDDSPYLYQPDSLHFVIGKLPRPGPGGVVEDELPRTAPGEREPRRALIGDPRNDENVVVSQIHLGLLKYHNAVVDALPSSVPAGERFDEARRIVRWHYQWVVVQEYLRLIVGGDVVDDVFRTKDYVVPTAGGPRTVSLRQADPVFYHYKNQPFMPVEFSVAAYRFGHSMVRPDYDLNGIVRQVPIFVPDDAAGPLDDLRGFRERPIFLEIEWRRFFRDPDGSDADLQLSRRINTRLASGLRRLPLDVAATTRSLATRNLIRGKMLSLASGQVVARAMGMPEDLILTGSALGLSGSLAARFGRDTPLWFYILKEAEVHANGLRLGPVGGRIVAEVFIGLLDGDPLSYHSIQPGWKPTAGRFGAAADGRFGMLDLLRFAGATI